MINGILYFSANDGINGNELWQSDGTIAGTKIVKNISAAASSNPANLISVNNTLYFTASDATSGVELWKSDGTDAGTVMINAGTTTGGISPNAASSNPVNLTDVNGTLYFTASDGTNGVGTVEDRRHQCGNGYA